MVVVEDLIELPDGETMEYIRFAESTSDSVAAIAINEAGEFLLQKEYSYPPNEIMWQLAGGSVNTGESPEHAIDRELAEESGVRARHIESLGFIYTDNRRSNQKQHIFVCKDLYKSSKPADKGEFVENHWIGFDELVHLFENDAVHNVTMMAALSLYFAKQGYIKRENG